MNSPIKISILLVFTACSLVGQIKKKTYQRKPVDHLTKEVIQPRYWNRTPYRQELATVSRYFAGEVVLKATSVNKGYFVVDESKMNAEDAEELERWKAWAPRKVYHSPTREWNTSVYNKKAHKLIPQKIKAKLLYTIGEDVLLQVGTKRKIYPFGALSRKDRRYVLTHCWNGESVKMSTSGSRAEELKKAGFEAYEYKTTIADVDYSLPYQLFSPKKNTRKVPLVVFFHGLGETGTDNINSLKHEDPMVFVSEKNQRNYPCYFVVPQHPSRGRGWIGSLQFPSRHSYLVKEMVMELRNSHPNIDPDRIYVTGLSSGAWGAYMALSHFPYIYAAGLPVSEAIETDFFTKENAKPMWILYNERDKSSLVNDAKKLEAHLSRLGVRPRVTVFESGGHNAWEDAYGKSGIINWLFRQEM